MRICRFDDNRLGLVQGDSVLDVTQALEILPECRYPLPAADLLYSNLDAILARVTELAPSAQRHALKNVKLLSPVANPSKIVGAPVNYNDHLAESRADINLSQGNVIKTIGEWGLFFKTGTSLVGPGEGVKLRFPESRTDHEGELVVIIGKAGTNISRDEAMSYVAGYCLGLDMTVRGIQQKTMRASIDTYAVLGPWFVTADEVAEPGNLDFWLKVNGETRQASNTSYLVYDIPKLIEFASSYYTLLPGDVIFTGTPAGVGPVVPGDVIDLHIDQVGAMQVAVSAA